MYLMIKARHKPLFVRFFNLYTDWMLKWHFEKVCIHSDFIDNGKAILLIGNHFSWWDGFFVNHLNRRVFRRKLHIMMLEEQLSSRMFLNKAGAFSIKRGNRSVFESLNYSIEILKDDRNILSLFPQGEIETLYRFPVSFEKGWFRIIEQADHPFQIVFMVNLVDYFSNRKPALYQHIKGFKYDDIRLSPGSLEKAFNDHLASSIQKQKE